MKEGDATSAEDEKEAGIASFLQLERNLETGMSHVMSSEVTLQSSPVSLSVSKLSINLTLIKSLSVYVGVYIIER